MICQVKFKKLLEMLLTEISSLNENDIKKIFFETYH
jgi:hypothetical protein